MYIQDVEDLFGHARSYFGRDGSCRAYSSGGLWVKLQLHGVHVFYLQMPVGEMRADTVAFFHQVADGVRNHVFLGVDLSAIPNTQEDVEAAFGVIHRYSRLMLPDKFLAAFDALTPKELRP
ncbi:hypothetical protein G7067_11775 [Leucobacter insecticola]|uniref:Uncharacterized protein n=1 Tax=Leucobacter insecticola TaxID=2714934 RepID=A0A6G8FKP4_9MICO|nr:hypothetical protein [Leucobacter insecticola]QIM16924.1 hypothetical protein G7067_11775 [Leucobacter insecticola]